MKIVNLFIVMASFAICIHAETNFGTGAQIHRAIPVSQILQSPEKYIGKEVTVTGQVIDVCEKRGCWMKFASDNKHQTLRVKVKDGEMVFPISARGKKGVAKGELKKISFNQKQTVEFYKHLAEEKGEKFDPSIVKGPMTFYQVKASGVTIQ